MPNIIKIGNQSILVMSANKELNKTYPFFSTMRYVVGKFDGYRFEADENQSREFDVCMLYKLYIIED